MTVGKGATLLMNLKSMAVSTVTCPHCNSQTTGCLNNAKIPDGMIVELGKKPGGKMQYKIGGQEVDEEELEKKTGLQPVPIVK